MNNFTKDNYYEYFTFLDSLRESGITNMFGAAPYLQERYDITKYQSRDILSKWMETFDGKSSVDDRVAKAYP